VSNYQHILAAVKAAINGEDRTMASVALVTALEDLGYATVTLDCMEKAGEYGLEPALLACEANSVIELDEDLYDWLDVAAENLTEDA
jgi:hypothetical protein